MITWRLPQWRCSHRYLVPGAVTTGQWLNGTQATLDIYYHGAPCRNLATRYLVGNYTVTDGHWLDTLTHSHCARIKVAQIQFCSLPLVPLVDERTVTASSLPSPRLHEETGDVYIFCKTRNVCMHLNFTSEDDSQTIHVCKIKISCQRSICSL